MMKKYKAMESSLCDIKTSRCSGNKKYKMTENIKGNR